MSVTENGTYRVGDYGYDGFRKVVVDVAGEGYDMKEITEGALLSVSIISNSASFVASGVFGDNYHITEVNLPQCEYVNDEAFIRCSFIDTVSLPVCEAIGSSVFRGCNALYSVYINPSCSVIGESAFYNCNQLISLSLPNYSSINAGVFMNCSFLTNLRLSNKLDYIGSNAFRGCGNLTAFNTAFANTGGGVGQSAFASCNGLTTVDLTDCNFIGSSAFINCPNLSKVTLRASQYGSVCTLYSRGLPYSNTVFSLYVPESLLSDYKAAQYYSLFANKIFSITEPLMPEL